MPEWRERKHGVRMTDMATTLDVAIVPANEASWEDLQAVLGARGDPARCAVAPRSAHPRLLHNTRVPWEGRAEDKSDDSVWSVTCFVTRAGFRRRGISRALARAAVDFARARGARALEGYPMITQPGQEITWGELHVGSRSIFEAAGFEEVSHPTLRRVVMRIDF
jgi:GNAT superfamily N-acetyltransferase